MATQSIEPCPLGDGCPFGPYECFVQVGIEHRDFYRGDRDTHNISGCPPCSAALRPTEPRAGEPGPGTPATPGEGATDPVRAALGPCPGCPHGDWRECQLAHCAYS